MIHPRPGEPIDSVLKRFKKAVDANFIMWTYRRAEHFIPRPEARRKKSLTARKGRT